MSQGEMSHREKCRREKSRREKCRREKCLSGRNVVQSGIISPMIKPLETHCILQENTFKSVA